MGKKKKLKQQENERKKKEMENVIRSCKCLRCGKPMVKNHKSCSSCNRKDKLKSKANKRGRKKNHYLD